MKPRSWLNVDHDDPVRQGMNYTGCLICLITDLGVIKLDRMWNIFMFVDRMMDKGYGKKKNKS